MIRIIALIAVASFVLAVTCFAGATALGGRDLLWRHWARDWTFDVRDDDHNDWRARHFDTGNVSGTREFAWTGGDTFEIDVPADVQFTQGPGAGKLTITGPKDTLDRLTLSGGTLAVDDGEDSGARVTIVMTAPAVRHFALNGDESLTITGLDQDQLDLDIAGHGEAKATGKAKAAHVEISGDGDVDLSKLAAQSADVDINGSGRAEVAPTEAANLRISGSGEVDLDSRPASLSSDVSGSGRIVQGARAAS